MTFGDLQIEDPLGEKPFFWEKRSEKMSRVESLSFGGVVQEESTLDACVQQFL